MKQVVGLVALLVSKYGASAFVIARQDDTGKDYHAPCTQEGYKQFLIRDWHGITYSNTTEIFSFELHANFSGYVSPCHGERSGDTSSGWIACDVRDESAGVGAYFDFSSNDYVTINHTYVCDRGEEETDPNNQLAIVIATGDGRLSIGLVDTPEGHYTGTEGDNMTIAAYTEVAHRLPNPDCSAASQQAEWEVRDFHFSTRVSVGSPWVIGATVANINYDLYNKANDYLINCQAVNSSTLAVPDDPQLINTETQWPCPINYRDDLFPPEAYPATDFKFDRSQNELTIEQRWECSEDGHETTFSAVATTVLPLKCEYIPFSDDSPVIMAVECDLVTTSVKAELML
ncbi:hypothetical protein F4820DRAFT_449672 [Hypoxylon rubiginosum]|uniref:Uncharacterized protein n=1 Tax=Hypoxylon rubiginosum TaxID=110542 RepID=A0ACB9YYL9_9PEZI|nr:hypothetical protein F4820DRAFT_449672 [Hypoxylon rubiginosum]